MGRVVVFSCLYIKPQHKHLPVDNSREIVIQKIPTTLEIDTKR